MAKIDIYTNDVTALAGRLKSITGTIEDARTITSKVRNGLDFQIKARSDIETKLDKVKKNLKNGSDRVSSLSGLANTAVTEFQNTDRKTRKRSDNFLGKIRQGLSGIAHSIKEFFVNSHIDHHTAITGLFLTAAPVVAAPISIVALSTILHDILHPGQAGSSTGHSGGGHSSGGNNSGVTTVEVENNTPIGHPAIYNGLPQSMYRESAEHPGYSVLNGLESAYKLKQDVSGPCGAIALATMLSMLHPEQGYTMEKVVELGYSDEGTYKMRWGKATNFRSFTKENENAKQEVLNIIKDQLKQGKPCVMAVYNNSTHNMHYVTVVGAKNVDDVANLTYEDLLVQDPATGTCRVLGECTSYIIPPHDWVYGQVATAK